MTSEERFMFDLEGYLVIRNVLSEGEVSVLNEVSDREFPRDYSDGNDSKGRLKIRRAAPVSCWDPACRSLLNHPGVIPYLSELLGPKFRIDHDYAMFMEAGNDGGNLHGFNELGSHRYFTHQDGVMRIGLTVVTFFLAPAGPGDGGFVCIPGSHKSNFPKFLPEKVRTLESLPRYLVQPEVRAGDVVIFTEALSHGTLAWRGKHERRAFLYKYNPGHMANHSIYDLDDYSDLTEQQRKILSAPSVGGRPDVA